MEPIIVALDERLANPGDTIVLAEKLPAEGYSLGDHDFSFEDGVSFDVVLTNAGEGILVTGIVHARAKGTCDRCLDEAVLDLSGEVNEYFLYEEPDPSQLADDEDEADFSLISPDNTIDLSEPLMQALLMETPFVVLCKEDCAGLCPVCGENLNHVDCGHAAQLAQEAAQQRLDESPFAALKDLKLDD